ncbi:hypothetical protein CVT25_005715 [Psilocybe cyanescens]|uniref:Protein YOP1 n=1 Tax=Psilocybe cyanescens TaxID=93625 RepID=A0A409VLH0_PSICY|nr:hypothetical protein CVT25_005715 [Psilocybe cyanescens]
MIMSTISRLLSAWFAFLLPCYATYKALSRRPLSESDLQKWSMYWTGSTYIYNAHLQPFFSRNEVDLDAGIVRIQRNILTFVQEKLSALWSLATRGRPQSQAQSSSASPNPQLSWLLSPDTWRSALNVLQPASAGAGTALRGVQPVHSAGSSRTSLNLEETSQKNPPFPVPQHYE